MKKSKSPRFGGKASRTEKKLQRETSKQYKKADKKYRKADKKGADGLKKYAEGDTRGGVRKLKAAQRKRAKGDTAIERGNSANFGVSNEAMKRGMYRKPAIRSKGQFRGAYGGK